MVASRSLMTISRPLFSRLPAVFSRSMCSANDDDGFTAADRARIAEIDAEVGGDGIAALLEREWFDDWYDYVTNVCKEEKADLSVVNAHLHKFCTVVKENPEFVSLLDRSHLLDEEDFLRTEPQMEKGGDGEEEIPVPEPVEKTQEQLAQVEAENAHVEKILFQYMEMSATPEMELVKGIVGGLIDTGRFQEVLDKEEFFRGLASDGAVECIVTTAANLNAARASEIEAKLKAYAQSRGETVDISYNIDPSILGGLNCQYGSFAQDLSSARTIDDVISDVRQLQ